MPFRRSMRLLAPLLMAGAGVAVATGIVAALERWVGVPNAAAVYVVAVSAAAIAVGTWGAVLAAVIAVLVYDYFFTSPLQALSVADPGELLNLVLLLFVAVTVGQLASLQRHRAEVAEAREREARSLVEVAGLLAGRRTVEAVLPSIASVLAREPGMAQVLISLGADEAAERVATTAGNDPTDRAEPGPRPAAFFVLHRAGAAPTWTRIRAASNRESMVADPAAAQEAQRPLPGASVGAARTWFRVRIESGGRVHGSIWALRRKDSGSPSAVTGRLMAVTADQLAQALDHDRLEEDARLAEVARRSDELKAALLDAVSHDLRTPLASIRAYAGTLMDEELRLASHQVRTSAAAIDREAQRLNRIVANLLDLGRIKGATFRPRRELLDLEDVVEGAITQVASRLAPDRIELAIPPGLAVESDQTLLDQVLVNLLENVAVHTPPDTTVAITAVPTSSGRVRLTVEDSGLGVPRGALPHLFDEFFQAAPSRAKTATRGAASDVGRAAGSTPRRQRGSGLGLAVVRGLTEALSGTVRARQSARGGLAIELELPAPPPSPSEAEPEG